MVKGLGWRLLLAYLAVMGAIFGTSSLAVYFLFVRILYGQLDSRLLTLAQSAAPSLTAIKTQGENYIDEREEIAWQKLFRRNQQSLTWFNADQRKLASRGVIKVDDLPVRPEKKPLTLKDQQIRTITIPILLQRSALHPPKLEGYIRASESTREIERIIASLRWGFVGGSIVALGLSGLGGVLLVQKSLEPTRKSYQTLKRFTADASHELRSPLTAIKTSLEVMLKHPERIHPKNTKKLAAISSATDQMISLVEDLLFLARSDSSEKKQKLEKAPLSVYHLLQEALTLLEPQAQNQHIALKSALIPEVVVIGDEAKLSRLFSNLLENALQYTPRGGTVQVRMEKSPQSVFISFEDTGIGIAQNQLHSVFQRLWRTDRARSHRGGGSGLGLPIAQAIARQHKGKITVTSRVGTGSCFRVKLPIAPASPEGTLAPLSPLGAVAIVDRRPSL